MMGHAHPFFVHAPLVFVPTAALMAWLGRWLRRDGFDVATYLVTLAAALAALASLASGWWAAAQLGLDGDAAEVARQHRINAVVLTSVAGVAALLALAEWRGLLGRRAWWLRGALLSWAAIGAFTLGHSGAKLVYVHGAGVAAQAPR